MEIIAFLTTL